jgi:dihydroorotate dehydrogenase (NAD+) catalytic subunit
MTSNTSGHHVPLAVSLAGVPLRNPVLLAAGTAGLLDEMADVVNLALVGGVVTKSITPLPREGNATWRIITAEHGGGRGGAMLNAIGLANVGLEAFMRDVAPKVPKVPTAVIGSVSGFSIEDYVAVARAFDTIEAMPAIEINVSCPNVKSGAEFASDAGMLRELVGAVRAVVKRARLLVKLSPVAIGQVSGGTPGVPGIVSIAKAAIEGAGVPGGPNSSFGADALCLANTVPAMAIDVHTRRPRLARGSGGLSGPAIHPIAVKLVRDAYVGVCKDAKVPIVGIGGVLTWEDAAEFVLAGASAVQMGTALFVDPRSPLKVVRGLTRWTQDQGCATISELVGNVIE